MTHAEMSEVYELYALGVLEPEAAAEIDQHLRDGCEHCERHVADAMGLVAAMASLAEPESPRAQVRERILGVVKPQRQRPTRNWMYAAAALAAACAALIIFSVSSRSELRHMRERLAALTEERDQLRSAVQILSRPDTRAVGFGRAGNAPHGRVLVNRNGGFVFVGSQLPELGSNQTFELWLVPASGAAPQPAGLFRPNAQGDSVHVSSAAVDARTTKAVAVSVEPSQGSNAPTTTPILVVPLA
ncbi:MAG: anti-sigma factor [Acidobacteriaceae bacterium]|nr:anti-sigma factor [Acidobacteriaceae bacterium]